jgi:hypothetical protein
VQKDKVMVDAQYEGRGVLTCCVSLVHECLQVFFNRFPQRCFFFRGPLECCLDEYGATLTVEGQRWVAALPAAQGLNSGKYNNCGNYCGLGC